MASSVTETRTPSTLRRMRETPEVMRTPPAPNILATEQYLSIDSRTARASLPGSTAPPATKCR